MNAPRGRPKAVVLLCTAPTQASAQRLARELVTRHLAACVSCLPGASSFFWWQGRLDIARETLLLIKTVPQRLATAIRFIKRHHGYTVPELIALPVTQGDATYLRWLKDACRG